MESTKSKFKVLLEKLEKSNLFFGLLEEYNEEEKNIIEKLNEAVYKFRREDITSVIYKASDSSNYLFPFMLGLIDGTISRKLNQDNTISIKDLEEEKKMRKTVVKCYETLNQFFESNQLVEYIVYGEPPIMDINKFINLHEKNKPFIDKYKEGIAKSHQVDLKKIYAAYEYRIKSLLEEKKHEKKHLK